MFSFFFWLPTHAHAIHAHAQVHERVPREEERCRDHCCHRPQSSPGILDREWTLQVGPAVSCQNTGMGQGGRLGGASGAEGSEGHSGQEDKLLYLRHPTAFWPPWFLMRS